MENEDRTDWIVDLFENVLLSEQFRSLSVRMSQLHSEWVFTIVLLIGHKVDNVTQ